MTVCLKYPSIHAIEPWFARKQRLRFFTHPRRNYEGNPMLCETAIITTSGILRAADREQLIKSSAICDVKTNDCI